MLKKFISYYKPHKLMFFFDMLASFIVAMVGIVYPILTRKMLNEFIPQRQSDMIIFFGSLLLALYIIRMCLNYFIQYQGHMIGVKMQAKMRSDMFDH